MAMYDASTSVGTANTTSVAETEHTDGFSTTPSMLSENCKGAQAEATTLSLKVMVISVGAVTTVAVTVAAVAPCSARKVTSKKAWSILAVTFYYSQHDVEDQADTSYGFDTYTCPFVLLARCFAHKSLS